MANQINVIKPYRWHGMWVFDDERVGLAKEPFVAGADTIIDVAVARKQLPDADRGFPCSSPKTRSPAPRWS